MGDLESALMSHVGQAQCPQCLTWVQRTQEGDVADGMAAHQAAVHKGGEGASGG